MTNDELIAALKQMDVPDMRLDVSSRGNVRWLLRNLGVRNAGHPLFSDALASLKRLTRGGK